jgi:predicted permease
VVTATLAVGVGLNTALFSVVDGVLIRPLPYREPQDLVYLEARQEADGVDDVLVSGGDLRALREGVGALDQLEGIATIRQTLNGAGLPRQVQVGWTSPGFLSMLGAETALGRTLRPDDPPGTVVLSHGLWQDGLGADPDVLGRTVRLDGHPHTVVGVLASGFRLSLPARGDPVAGIEIWKNPDTFWQNGDIWNSQGPGFGLLRLVGRLRQGASRSDAQNQVDAVVAGLHRQDEWYARSGFQVAVLDLKEQLVAGVRPILRMLLGAVAFVLLIACANVANLILVRTRRRRRELAVRLALGSPRGRLGRSLFLESLFLALGSAVVGLVLVLGFMEVVPHLVPDGLPRMDTIALDHRVLGFSVAVALVATFLVGTAPAVLAARTDPARELGGGRNGGAAGHRFRDGLVVLQVALSLVLLVGAALLTSSLVRLRHVDPGFEPEGLSTFAVSIPGASYGWPEEADRFYRRVEDVVADLPGVSSAGVVWPMPFGGQWSGQVEAGAADPRELGIIPYELATESYFSTAGIPLREGRLFDASDPRNVVVVSAGLAERAFPGRRAVGRTVRANPWGGGMVDFEIIGVVGDVRDRGLRSDPEGAIYFDSRGWAWVDWEVHVLARTEVGGAALLPALREAVAELDPSVPVARPQPMTERMAAETASTRFVLFLLGGFAVAAGLLAVVGLYAVVSYVVGMRRREFGIRLALGAGRGAIQGMVLGRGVRLAALGVAIGVCGALLLGDLLETLLFGVTPGDPVTLVVVVGVMTAAATLASWIPARRASASEPREILRAE